MEDTSGWERIWKTKGPLRFNLLLWTATHDRLPIAEFFFKCHCAPTPNCSMCVSPLETSIHALRDYNWCNKVWEGLPRKSGLWDFFTKDSIGSWMDYNLDGKNVRKYSRLEWKVIFKEGMNRIWYWRNHHLYDSNTPIPATWSLLRDILYRNMNILADVYKVSPNNISFGDQSNLALGHGFFVWPWACIFCIFDWLMKRDPNFDKK